MGTLPNTLAAWTNDWVLARAEGGLGLSKPAFVEPRSGFRSLEQRLEDSGEGRFRVHFGALPRASGACWALLPQRQAPPPARCRFELVVGLDAFGEARGGRLGAYEYRALRRVQGRCLIEVKGTGDPLAAVQALVAERHRVVGAAGGPACTRTLAHVRRLDWPGLPTLRVDVPSEFGVWLEGRPRWEPEQLERALLEGAAARWELAQRRSALRLASEQAGEIAGLTVDWYAGFALLAVSSEQGERCAEQLAQCLLDHGAKGVYLKRRVRSDLRRRDREALAAQGPLLGAPAPEPFRVQLEGMTMGVSLDDGLSTGVFLDQAANWARVAERVGAGRLLNLFCYTGAFTVAAARAGASSVSVDLSGKALRRLRDNLQAAGQQGSRHRLHKADALDWLRRAVRRGERFDAVVLDPPSFGTRRRGVLSLERDYGALVADCLRLLAPGGVLVSVVHQRELSAAALGERVQQAAAQVGLHVRTRVLAGDWDCRTLPGVSTTKSLLIEAR